MRDTSLSRCAMRIAGFAIATVLALLIQDGASPAASFDCKKATTVFEKTVCATPELSQADDALAQGFAQALEPLSPTGSAALRDSERAWLRYAATVCRLDGVKRKPRHYSLAPKECLETEYGLRLASLGTAASMIDGVLVRGVVLYSADPRTDPDEEENGYGIGFNTSVLAYPQIDHPRDEAESAWNQYIARRVDEWKKDRNGFVRELRYDDLAFTVETILVTLQYSVASGGVHPDSLLYPVTWLKRQNRPLVAEDVLDRAKKWQEPLAEACLKDLLARAEPGEGADYVKIPAKLLPRVSDAENWLVTSAGISVQFAAYEIASNYRIGLPRCLVPWRALTPYLVAKPALSIPPR
ncbi:MAG: DUF1311 domain-containing protein [Hyphomicrobiales bacterium]|nr:DUF1311 domain-containing protein [Hyphomicrobiales bacterium]MBV9052085.1 DUF1311 domain-containing protein [Hyphomicrobiales bacterium]MBV9590445.1 DUF1311 domain-containing protein [Hyphomicrobiales bacterium]MBV9975059.1 DUF1311 domain-containing protein [Hyphomicrobiales bacterium]